MATDPTAARAIAQKVATTPADVPYLTCVALLMIGLTHGIRQQLQTWLEQQQAFLQVQKAQLVAQSQRYDVLTTQQKAAVEFLHTVLDPLTAAFNAVTPFLKNTACAGQFMSGITNTLPVRIPASAAANFVGLGGFDLFEGVQTYGDFKAKLEDLTWRLARTASASAYVGKASAAIDSQLKFIDAYINMLSLI